MELEGEVTIRQAADLAAQIGEAWDGSAPVVVETASLEDADTGILQLLCSLLKTAPSLSFGQP